MIRRAFFASLLAVVAPFSAMAQRRKRKPKPKAAVRQSETINPIEKAQLLASFDDDQIQTALNVRFLGLYSEEELRAELAAREVRRRNQK